MKVLPTGKLTSIGYDGYGRKLFVDELGIKFHRPKMPVGKLTFIGYDGYGRELFIDEVGVKFHRPMDTNRVTWRQSI